jgi:Uncharacterized protein conserved in bacteria
MTVSSVEIDMVVSDSMKALALYEKIFEVQRIEVTDFGKGKSEAVFSIFNSRFHLLDENPEYHLFAPKEDAPQSMWFNVVVPDIRETYENAISTGCIEIQPITEISELGIINGIFKDLFGYVWMLHQVVKEVSYEERLEFMKNM